MHNAGKYDDIIALPHHQSETRAHMPLIDRAAQFAPFAALTGYDAAVEETARLTDEKTELADGMIEELNEKLRLISENISARPAVSVTRFVPDERKSGGAYVIHTGRVRRVDPAAGSVLFEDGLCVYMEDISQIDLCSDDEWTERDE